jgi:hypothetical protein
MRKLILGLAFTAGLVGFAPNASSTGTIAADQLNLVNEQAPSINSNTDAQYRGHGGRYYYGGGRYYYGGGSYYSYYRTYYSSYYRPYYRPYYWGN